MYQVDVYLRVRRAVMVDGMSIREVSRVFGLHRDTVRKILAYSVPPGYRRQTSPRRPKLEPFTGVIDQILATTSGVCPASTIVAEKSSISFAGSPPLPGPVAGLHPSGSWGRQTRG